MLQILKVKDTALCMASVLGVKDTALCMAPVLEAKDTALCTVPVLEVKDAALCTSISPGGQGQPFACFLSWGVRIDISVKPLFRLSVALENWFSVWIINLQLHLKISILELSMWLKMQCSLLI